MVRLTFALSLILAFTVVLFSGCRQQAGDKPADGKPQVKLEPKLQPGEKPVVEVPGGGDKKPAPPAVDHAKLPMPAFFTANDKQDMYDSALNEALEMLAQRKLPEALTALEAACGFQDNEFIRGEIAKVKQRLDQDGAAKSTVQNIETVLAEGKASEAAKLSSQALKEFGGSDDAKALVKLQLQADALASVQQKDEGAETRYNRFRGQGEAALTEKNLRAAALAFEQAVLARADAALQAKLDDIRGNLEKYDALRGKAAELRKDPAQIEEALTALQAAQEAWDTLQVRQDLDEYTLALQKRRDTLSVADFELRADLGMPDMGRSLADELLPLFKSRFDLVERTQLGKVIAELKLEQGLDDPVHQRELAKLARVRYLVLGSVYQLAGITVQARLVDARTGLVVQTAKIVAPTVQEVVARLPDLAKQLTMSDDEKMAFDAAQQQKFVKLPFVIDADAALPPPPAPALGGAADVVPDAVRLAPAPPFAGLKIELFRGFAAAPAAGVVFAPPAGDGLGVAFRNRFLFAAVQRGDYFIRIGNFGEARRQFQFALNVAPANPEVLQRVAMIEPFAPPVMLPVFVAKPRIAVLEFFVAGDPRVVPPSLGAYAPQQLAPYLAANFEVVDPGLVYWYMGSVGMSMNDLMTNPAARQWLGRAVGVRYFLLGTVEQAFSFDVTTYLLDAEFGYLQGSGRIHVRNPFELRLRLGELAQVTLMTPAQREAFLAQAQVQAFNALVFKGRIAMQEQEFVRAVQFFDEALAIRPDAFDVLLYRSNAERLARVQALQQRRVQFLVGPQFAVIEVQRRQRALVLSVEQARIGVVRQTAGYGEAERVVIQQQRVQAQTVLITQAQLSFKTKNFGFSVNVYESAMGFVPPGNALAAVVVGDPWRELAQARLAAATQTQLIQTQALAQQEAALRQQRENELAAARAQLALQQQQLEAARQAHVQKDKQAYTRAMAEGQDLLAKKNHDGAAAAFLVAQRLNKTPVVDNLLELTAKNRALATAKNDTERLQLEAKLEAERAQRVAAEALAKRNQDLYLEALQTARAALAKKDYVIAQAKFNEAAKVYKTDAVTAGLRQVAQARAQDDAAIKAQQAAQQKTAKIRQLLDLGNDTLKDKDYDQAVKVFQAAKQLAPDNVDVLAGLAKAEHARDLLVKSKLPVVTPPDNQKRLASFQAAMLAAQKAVSAKNYATAVKAYTDATKIMPEDTKAPLLLKQTQQAWNDAKLADADLAKRQADYAAALKAGQGALFSKKYDDAIKAFTNATKIIPGEAQAAKLLKQAQQAQIDARVQEEDLAKQKLEQQKKTDYSTLMKDAAAKMNGKQFVDAKTQYQAALKLYPTDPAALGGLKATMQALDTKTPPKDNKALYQKAMLDGSAHEKQQKYAEAVKSYETALELMPKDLQASTGLRRAQLGLHLVDGQRFLDGARWADAQREFEAALQISPNDATAKKLLEKAKKKMK